MEVVGLWGIYDFNLMIVYEFNRFVCQWKNVSRKITSVTFEIDHQYSKYCYNLKFMSNLKLEGEIFKFQDVA